MEIKTEWEVAWFPSDGPDASKTYATEAAAVRKFEAEKEHGSFPALSTRTVSISDWDVVRNSANGI